ncbi:hypothetical protein ROJ8625_01561 [Roseivivax jejudonensis]|uniref:Sulfotransferase family protein n=1 Tax=Roseivivax jejudonensis TaxID=1529041 RepID=A0A1X6YWK9_9RHOB|nr:hypothetical protein [Roseivivax jejudonensis]SLN33300.1 hypothetical protein ROJ8625_01561 [Roseivivax jejudonensis]
MECVVHIGTEKTGTTSIQRTLDHNAERLAAAGVIWPPIFRDGQDPRAACYAMDDDTIDLRKERRNLTTPEKIATFRAQFEDRFAREIDRGPDARTVLVVNEHLSRMRRPSEVRRLKTFLERHFDRVRVVVYLRRQDRMMRSMYSQVIKVGGTRPNVFPRYEDARDGDFTTFNYRRIADLWADIFGRAAFEIRVFESARLSGGDVVSDFLRVAGIPPIDGLEPSKTNESLSPEAIQVLRMLNRHLPRGARGNIGPLSGRIFTGSGIPVARAEAETFLGHFQADNDHVAQDYLGRPCLFEPIGPDEYPDSVPPEAMAVDLDTMAQHFASLWEAKIRGL